MQMVHEAALCISGLRDQRCLTQNDFALLNGLGGVASDPAVHALLNSREVSCSQATQVALGRIRRSLGHFHGSLLAIDPHRLVSYSQRRMRLRKAGPRAAAGKTLQTFFCLDAGTSEPVCFTTGSAARTVSQATPPLLEMAQQILGPAATGALVMADTEHFTANLLDHVATQTPFDLLTPMPCQPGIVRQIKALDDASFRRCWAGLALAKTPYAPVHSQGGPYQMIVQRFGEDPKQFEYNSFLCSAGNVKRCREQFEHLPERLAREGVDPRVPWLYNYPLDFRFR